MRRLVLAVTAITAGLAAAPTAAQAPVDFNRDIRPLLADRCFTCHGFDARARKADLRLDTREGMLAAREGGAAVVPGAAHRSALVRRIRSDDPRQRMPPPSSGLSLSAEERALLARWIDEGAPFAEHWAFTPPVDTAPPRVADPDAAPSALDRFVLDALERRGLGLSPQADRETLIRRVSLDLTGLPPTPEEIEAFVDDPAADAYEQLVERLLASPHYGERMAYEWLDGARYADTNGFHHDNVRTAWPYRDWVIDAFNQNLPFDQFATEQLAGDLLEDATTAQRIASGFCRMHNINDEGGALDAEYRVEAVCDRIETVSTVFMALTVACARCHDHKYDPFSQEDYYSLYAFFNSVDERGVYPAEFEQARAYPARLDYRPPGLEERAAAASEALEARLAELAAAAPTVEAEHVAAGRALRERLGVSWVHAPVIEAKSAAGRRMTVLDDGSVRAAADDPPAKDTHTLVLDTDAVGLDLLCLEALTDPALPKGSLSLASHGNAVLSHVRATAVGRDDPDRRQEIEFAWAWADHEQANGDFDVHNALDPDAHGWALAGHEHIETRTAILRARTPFGFEGGTRVIVELVYHSQYGQHIIGRPRVTLGRAVRDPSAEFPLVASDWWLAGPFSGEDFETVWRTEHGPQEVTHIDREARFGERRWTHKPDFEDGPVHRLRGERAAFYIGRTLRAPTPRTVTLSLGSDDAVAVYLNGARVFENKVMRGAAPDQDRVELALPAGESTLVCKVVNNGGPGGFTSRIEQADAAPLALAPATLLAPDRRDAALGERCARAWARHRSPTYAALDDRRREAEQALAAIEAEAVPVLVMAELDTPRPAHVLTRGRYDLADENRPVERRPPSVLGAALPAAAPKNRLGFARWLTRADHPLTARVRVNRLWQLLFGTGIVKTSENFGMQSDWPSHLALLDWLAHRFVESGWDQKAMLRRMVNSATYKQSSRVRTEARAIDPDNRWLAYFPRRRLAGELIRDQALFAAGLLQPLIGGPSVKPYQPEGLWKEVSIGASSNTRVFERDHGTALHRRSLYTFWKRTSPNPQMAIFDAPTREFCVVQRATTNTPLQSLVLWNDEQFTEAARVLAQRTLAEHRGDGDRLRAMYRRCTGRTPAVADLQALTSALAALRTRYAAAPEDAEAVLATGEAPRTDAVPATELAPWMLIASAILSLDDTLVRS